MRIWTWGHIPFSYCLSPPVFSFRRRSHEQLISCPLTWASHITDTTFVGQKPYLINQSPALDTRRRKSERAYLMPPFASCMILVCSIYRSHAQSCLNFILLLTSCVGLQEKEPQSAYPMSSLWASRIAARVLSRHTLPSRSYK